MTRTPEPLHLSITGGDAAQRGRARGESLREHLPTTLELYLRLFDSAGIPLRRVREHAARLSESVESWHPATAREIDAVASGSGLDSWQVMALNGRTEILADARAASPECSTLVLDSAADVLCPFGIQTWDWHRELDRCWHTQTVVGTRFGYTGLTEVGILAKIGVNGAGLGVFFNILGHRADAPTSVPIHLLAARLLAEASSVAEAIDIVEQTPMASSGALTLLDRYSAACVEISPVGTTTLRPRHGYLAHTNHFLAPSNAVGEKPGLYEPDSQQRLALIDARMADAARTGTVPTCPDHADEMLRSSPGEPQLCCIPSADAPFGQGWATLATIALEPAALTARIRVGSPATGTEFRSFTAPAARAAATIGGSR